MWFWSLLRTFKIMIGATKAVIIMKRMVGPRSKIWSVEATPADSIEVIFPIKFSLVIAS